MLLSKVFTASFFVLFCFLRNLLIYNKYFGDYYKVEFLLSKWSHNPLFHEALFSFISKNRFVEEKMWVTFLEGYSALAALSLSASTVSNRILIV